MDKIKNIVTQMSFEEKAHILTGCGNMSTYPIESFGVRSVKFADGPHGTRLGKEKNCTHFPSLCNLGSSWDVETARKMGNALADECINNNISMLLGPGINIKRHILCGRNFEYISEDPVLSGEIAAAYVNGLQEKGVSACVKHYAVNNQEKYRSETSVEIDERTLREIYLKAFEIVVKKSHPDSIMCAYNKVNAIWCSENEYLLKKILKEEWNYDGMVVSDWGAVHNISRAIKAGLDLEMPSNPDIAVQLKEGLESGLVSMEDIDNAVMRMLNFLDRSPVQKTDYNRDNQHLIAKEIAANGMVLLKNTNETLPITSEKYKKVAVIGEYAVSPLICGQGSAEVLQSEEYTDNILTELQKRMPEIEFKYLETYKKREFSDSMLWPKVGKFRAEIADCELILMFLGAMESEDTENFDRRTAELNPNFEMFIEEAVRTGKRVVVVLQNGGALILNKWNDKVDSVVEMWLAGEATGGAVADVLCGIVNPAGKLSETFPKIMRCDLEYPGDGLKVEYKERFDVGYRYYDKHPEEILYPFGHGISYTEFEYKNLVVNVNQNNVSVEFDLKNIGKYDGAEVVQLYIGDPVSTVVKPVKELKKFKKVFLKSGEQKKISFDLLSDDFSYYNVMLRKWSAENGVYNIFVGSSSQDIRLESSFSYGLNIDYTIESTGESMIG